MVVNKSNSRSSGETTEFDSVISSETSSSIISESLEVAATNRQCQTARKRTFRRNDAKRCQDTDDDIDEEVRTKKLRNYATKTITRVYDREVSHYSDDDIIVLDQEEDAKTDVVEPDIVIFDSDASNQDQGELEEWKTVEIQTQTQTARKRTSKPRLSAGKEDKPVVKRVKNVAKKSTSRASSITSNSEDYYDDTESAKSDEPYVATESVEDFNDESDDKYSTKSVSYAKKSTAKSQIIQKLFS